MTITLRFMNVLDRYNRDSIRYDVSHTDIQGNKLRKKVSTGIKVKTKDIDYLRPLQHTSNQEKLES